MSPKVVVFGGFALFRQHLCCTQESILRIADYSARCPDFVERLQSVGPPWLLPAHLRVREIMAEPMGFESTNLLKQRSFAAQLGLLSR